MARLGQWQVEDLQCRLPNYHTNITNQLNDLVICGHQSATENLEQISLAFHSIWSRVRSSGSGSQEREWKLSPSGCRTSGCRKWKSNICDFHSASVIVGECSDIPDMSCPTPFPNQENYYESGHRPLVATTHCHSI